MADLKLLGVNFPLEPQQRQANPASDRLLIGTIGPTGGALGPLIILPVTPVVGADLVLDVSSGSGSILTLAGDGTLTLGQTPGGTTRGGVALWKTDVGSEPSGALGVGQLYTKDVTGVTQLFYVDGDGTEHQMTPSVSGVSDHSLLTGLGNDDHTIYLLASGVRSLTGNLAVTGGVTIDGRDVSVDGATLDSHLANFSNPHSVTTAQIGAATQADLLLHTSSTSNPHSTSIANIGGGTLAQLNAAISDADVVSTARSVIAGAGMTGGGTLASDRTFDVIAHVDGSIIVNADSVQVGVLATDAQHGVRGGGTQHSEATGSVAGFMSAADKVKLDGIVPGSGTLQDAYDAGNTIIAGAAVALSAVDTAAGTLLSLTNTTASVVDEPLLDLYASAMMWGGSTGIRIRLLTSNPKPGLILGDLGGEKLSIYADGLRGETSFLIQPNGGSGFQTRITGGMGSEGDGVTPGGDGGYLILDAGQGGLNGGAGGGADGTIQIGKVRASAIESGLAAGTPWAHVGNFTITSGVLTVPSGAAATPSIAVGSADTGLYAISGANDVISMVRDGVAVVTGGLNSTLLQVNGTSILSLAPTAISGSVQMRQPVGAVGTPSYSFTGQTTDGIYTSGTNFVDIASNGVRAMSVHQYDTRIYYNGTPYISFGPAGMTFFNSSSYSMHAMGTGMGLILGGRRDGTTNIVQNTDPTIRFTQYAALPFVGASISQKLLQADCIVNQTGTSSFSMFQMDITNTALGSGTNYFLDLKVAGTTVFAITNGTTAATQGRLLSGSGAAATPSISFLGDTDTGLASIAANAISMVTGGVEAWRFNGSDLNSMVAGAYIQAVATGGNLTFSGNITTATTPSFAFENFNAFTGTVAQRLVSLGASINQNAGGGFSALQINLTNTLLGAGAHYFLDAQVSGTTVAGITNGSTAALRGRVLAGPGASATPSLSFLGQTADGFYSQSSTNIGATGNLNPDITNTWSLGSASLRWAQLYAAGVTVDAVTITATTGEIINWPYTTMHFHGKSMLFDNAGEEYWIDVGGHFYTNSAVAYAVTRNSKVFSVNVNIYENTLNDDAELRLCVNGSFFAAAAIPAGFTGTIDMASDFDSAGLTHGDVFNWACTGTENFPAGTLSLTLNHQLRSQ